jgi:hypothetical protein
VSSVSFAAGISAAAAVQHQYFDAIRDLPGAQIPYTETPRLDPSEFVFEDAKTMTKEMLREVLYQEIEFYHPDLRAEWWVIATICTCY